MSDDEKRIWKRGNDREKRTPVSQIRFEQLSSRVEGMSNRQWSGCRDYRELPPVANYRSCHFWKTVSRQLRGKLRQKATEVEKGDRAEKRWKRYSDYSFVNILRLKTSSFRRLSSFFYWSWSNNRKSELLCCHSSKRCTKFEKNFA